MDEATKALPTESEYITLNVSDVFHVILENPKEKFIITSEMIPAITEVGRSCNGLSQFWIGKMLKQFKEVGKDLYNDLLEASKVCTKDELKLVAKRVLGNKITLPIKDLLQIEVDRVESKYSSETQAILDGLICNFFLKAENSGTK